MEIEKLKCGDIKRIIIRN